MSNYAENRLSASVGFVRLTIWVWASFFNDHQHGLDSLSMGVSAIDRRLKGYAVSASQIQYSPKCAFNVGLLIGAGQPISDR